MGGNSRRAAQIQATVYNYRGEHLLYCITSGAANLFNGITRGAGNLSNVITRNASNLFPNDKIWDAPVESATDGRWPIRRTAMGISGN